MAAREAQGQEWSSDEVKEVQELLEELPQRQGAPVMVPFGQVAFFPGHLIDTDKVFAEKRLAVAAAARAARDGGASSDAAPAAAAALEQGPRIGAGDAALLEMSPSEAAALLQRLLPPAAPQPPAPPQPQQPATQWSSGPQQPAPAQPAASRQVQQQAQQLSELVEGQTPEQLDALRAALQQLGASLERQEAAAAGGQAPSTEGKEIVDIREEWSEELHGEPAAPAAARPRPAAGPASASHQPAEEDAASEGGDSEQVSEDSFEALMQRMEALEMDEAALAEASAAAAAAAASAAAAAAQQAAAQPPGSRGGGSGAGGFKKGFLLGKALEPEAAGRQAGAAHSTQQLPAGAASAGAAAARDRQRQEREAAAAARREAAFSGRVVERPGSAPAPDPASPTALDRAAGPHSFPGVSVVERQPPPPPQQHQPEQPQAPQRVSRFKQRRAGLL